MRAPGTRRDHDPRRLTLVSPAGQRRHRRPPGLRRTRATLTAAEARQLAVALLAEAAIAEHPGGRWPAGQVTVTHVDGDSYAIVTRGHTVLVDQPAEAGGADTAATPTELFVGSLASCVAFYAGRFLQRHGLDRTDCPSPLTSRWPPTGLPGGRVQLRITVPDGVRPSGEPPCWPWPPTARCITPCSTSRRRHRAQLMFAAVRGGARRPKIPRGVQVQQI